MRTREWLGWVAAAFVVLEAVRMASAATAAAGAVEVPFNAIRVIAWGCVALLLRRAPAGGGKAVSRRHMALLVGGLGLLLLPLDRAVTNLVGWVVLSTVGLVAAGDRDLSAPERRAGAVMLAIAAQGFIAKWIAIVLERPILRLDTAAAGVAMQLVRPGSTWGEHTIRPPGGVGVTLYMACSSFANLSLVWLCFVALAALDGVAATRRAGVALLAISAVVIAINTVRIVLMAQSLPMYAYWHYGAGGRMLALGLSAATAAMCGLATRRLAGRRA